MIPLPLHRRLASRKAWSEASYQESSNLHSWVILPTHGPLQQAIFFVVNAKHGRGFHAAHGRARRMVALPPPRCMAEFRAYIAALQTYAVPGSEQRAASTRAFIILAARHRLLIYFE